MTASLLRNTASKAKLQNARILIADPDLLMIKVMRETLQSMGFKQIAFVRNGREALDYINKNPVDILITEWEMEHLNGIGLIHTLRQSSDARYAMLPVIMLTARAEQHDVVEARDHGATEFLVKPYTARTLYNLLEHIIEFPRDFIVCDSYVGPDRRRKETTSRLRLVVNRRVTIPITLPETQKMPQLGHEKTPHKIIPSHALKKKLAVVGHLADVITEEMLEQAESVIASFEEESLKHIAQDLQKLGSAMQQIIAKDAVDALQPVRESLLSLRAHAGVAHFDLAAAICFSLYGFVRNKLSLKNPKHKIVLQKHMDVLKVMLAKQIRGPGTTTEQQLVEGLSLLTHKFQGVT
jgi:two-component system chemotaxis response regulator CheY